MRKKSTVVFVCCLLLVILIAGYFTFQALQKKAIQDLPPSAAIHALQVSSSSASYTDIVGNPQSLTDYLGNVIVVVSWASWCPSCGGELGKLATLTNEFSDRGVSGIAINRAENAGSAERFLQTVPRYEAITLILDPTDHFYRSVSGYAMPETIVYNEEGIISAHFHGEVTEETLRSAIEAALEQ